VIEPFYIDEQTKLYHAEWRDVLDQIPVVDAIISDPPYGVRTLDGYATLRKVEGDALPKPGAEYEGWNAKDVLDFVWGFAPKNRGWWFILTSHDLIPAYEHAFDEIGLYHFAPVPIVMLANSVRYTGDGPASQALYGMAARPKTRGYSKWRSLPGYYTMRERGSGSGRGKPYELMLSIVTDYSREGDMVLDPFAGEGSTGRAAKDGSRNVILVERDGRSVERARSTMIPRRAFQQSMFAETP
jgi:hypothetical protein